MERLNRILVLALGLASFGSPARAQSDGSVPYALKDDSAFETGCFGPCDCAVLAVPLRGTFVLTRVDQNPLFTTYSLSDVSWTAVYPDRKIGLAGSGTYRVGGEFAVQHELVLDLSLDGGPPRRFGSGLIAGGGDFPEIRIDAAARGFACYDTVLAIHAAPTAHVDVNGDGARPGLAAIAPNPFTRVASFDVNILRSGPVELSILDPSGRLVRRVAAGLWLDPGHHLLAWDGRDDAGRSRAPGVYVVRLVSDGRTDVRRLVKLR